MVIMTYPPLASLTNGLLTAFNHARQLITSPPLVPFVRSCALEVLEAAAAAIAAARTREIVEETELVERVEREQEREQGGVLTPESKNGGGGGHQYDQDKDQDQDQDRAGGDVGSIRDRRRSGRRQVLEGMGEMLVHVVGPYVGRCVMALSSATGEGRGALEWRLEHVVAALRPGGNDT